MNKMFLGKALRDNWYLVGLFALILVAIPVLAMRGGTLPAEAPERAIPGASELSRNSAPLPPVQQRPTESQKARETIAEHQRRYEADPQGEDAPALLSAMGNLYRQKLSDYKEAASCFERYVTDFPDAPGARDAYVQLMICYDRMGDAENRSRVLRQMMDVYPPDSEEYKYASLQLGF